MIRPVIDLTGNRYGRWTVIGLDPIKRTGPNGKRSSRWKCRCDCGTVTSVFSTNLRNGTSTQCRKCGYEAAQIKRRGQTGRGAFKDLTGLRFGRWTVLKRAADHVGKKAVVMWQCRCDCGNVRDVQGGNLTTGMSTQCLQCGGKAAAVTRAKKKANS